MTLMEEEKMTKQMWKSEAERERHAKEEAMMRIREFERARDTAMRQAAEEREKSMMLLEKEKELNYEGLARSVEEKDMQL